MVESRTILYNILAGIITGVILVPLFYLIVNDKIIGFIYELTYRQLITSGFSQQTASRIANQTISSIKALEWIYPIGIIVDMFFISIVLGIINEYILRKTKVKTYIASIIMGLILLLVFQILPLMILSISMGAWIIEIYNKYIGFYIPILIAITYTSLLLLFTCIKGPWSKLLESKPKIY